MEINRISPVDFYRNSETIQYIKRRISLLNKSLPTELLKRKFNGLAISVVYYSLLWCEFKAWTFQDTFTGLGLVVATYLLTVFKLIPWFMKDKPAFKLKGVLLIYNSFQVMLSTYMVLYVAVRKYESFNSSDSLCPTGKYLDHVLYCNLVYFIAKHTDLLDTCFFALRRKHNQITFLHVYHHIVMVTWSWIMVFYHPSSHFLFPGMLNSLVHILMYGYYGIASLGPEYAKYIWWKKYLTSVQLIQFIICLIHFTVHYFWSTCPMIMPMFLYAWGNVAAFLVMFLQFYLKSYMSKGKTSE